MTAWTRTNPPLTTIRGSAHNYTMSFVLMRDGDRDPLDLIAPYQRASVWTFGQRRALIKSALLGIAPGAIYVSALPYSTPDGPSYRVVDGKQRVETYRMFANNEFAVPAEWFPDVDLDLDMIAEDGRVTYAMLSQRGQRGYENTSVPIVEVNFQTEWIEVEPGTGTNGTSHQFNLVDRNADEVLAKEVELYLLLNTAGTDHTEADIAHAKGMQS